MAGLYDLMIRTNQTPDSPRLSAHLLDALLVLYAKGEITQVQVRDSLNEVLAEYDGYSLSTDDQTDLSAIASEVDSQTGYEAKAAYIHGVHAASIFVQVTPGGSQLSLANETRWRSVLNISAP